MIRALLDAFSGKTPLNPRTIEWDPLNVKSHAFHMSQQNLKLDPPGFEVVVVAVFVARTPAELSHVGEERG